MRDGIDSRKPRGTGSWGLVGAVAAVVALLSCYGPLLLLAGLSLLGVSLVVNETLWAGAILAATAVTVLALLASFLRHRKPGSLLLALAGATLIFYALLGSYHVLVEGLGFVFLIAGVAVDLRNGRRKRASS